MQSRRSIANAAAPGKFAQGGAVHPCENARPAVLRRIWFAAWISLPAACPVPARPLPGVAVPVESCHSRKGRIEKEFDMKAIGVLPAFAWDSCSWT
jgi:hypothetical protein